jgi:signal transduction histidine kinase
VSRRIACLVAATTSAVILAFVVPLCLLVRELAQDRAMAAGEQEARNVAVLVSGLHGDATLADLVTAVDDRSRVLTSVLTPDHAVLGRPDDELARDHDVRRARREGSAFTVMSSDGGKVLVPVVTSEGTFVVRTMVPTESMRAGVNRAWASIGSLGILLILLSVGIAVRLGRRVSTPVTDLAEVALRFKDGDLDARATIAGPPETAALARAFNQLADRVTELLEAERSQVGDLSHRLRTPVTALRLDAEAIEDPEKAARLQGHIAHLQRMIDSIVRDARRPLQQTLRSSCEAADVIRDRMAFWGALAEDQGRPLQVEVAHGALRVPLDAGGLSDVLDVLVDNVFAHTADAVGFRVSLERHGERVRLQVADDGPGLPADTEGGQRPGSSGLGLQIVRRTAGAVGGELILTSGDGTTADLWLPLLDDQ